MQITTRLEFDAGHRIPCHKSQCRNLHGHRYAMEITLSGDVIGISSGNTLAASLSNTGVAAGTYTKVTVDTKGRVTSATSLGSSDVTTALGFTPVSTAGSTMTGPLILSGTPTTESQAVTKDYVDRKAFFALAVGIY